jgi:hypothetical protein
MGEGVGLGPATGIMRYELVVPTLPRQTGSTGRSASTILALSVLESLLELDSKTAPSTTISRTL